jgi:hypothetical protein
MLRKTLFTSLLASSALAFAVAGPAYAGKGERAKEAIAAAEAKVHTAESLGTGADVPHETAEARAALSSAKLNYTAGHETTAAAEALRASTLADTAISLSQRNREDTIAAAQDREAAAREQAAAAQQQAVTAQQQAADANSRADMAQQAAASSAADAAAARNAAALAAQTQPAQVETTVTTQQPAVRSTHRARTHVVRKTTRTVAAPANEVTTTTKVTQ